jgi:hypothetical protein
MAERTYTTKTRAKRIALEYFKLPHPFRRAKFLLSIALPVAAAIAVAGFAIRGDHRLYNSGPVSAAHSMFGARCGDCHSATPATAGGASRAAFFVSVSDEACSVCHAGPVHHDSQTFTPACSSCHFEHKGRGRLVDLGDRQCTQCHTALQTKDGRAPPFASKIAGFSSGHPEFSVAQTGARPRVKLDDATRPIDTAQVCLDHKTHLKPGLFRDDAPWYRKGKRGIVDRELRLTCTYCHQPDEQGAYMAPISYPKHCADCHPLVFDNDKFPGVTAPHDKPEVVHAFLRTKYTESPEGERAAKPATKEAAPEKVEEDAARPRRRIGAREEAEEEKPRRGRVGGGRSEPEEKPQPKTPKGFKEAEAILFFKSKESNDTCLLCHTLTPPAKPEPAARCGELNGKSPSEATPLVDRLRAALKDDRSEKLPVVAATLIPPRWLPHSRFDHRAHRSLGCAECHKAPESRKTADVLLPSVATCRECHRDSGGARTACVECHLYHDKTKEPDADGPLTVRRLARGVGPRAAGGSR